MPGQNRKRNEVSHKRTKDAEDVGKAGKRAKVTEEVRKRPAANRLKSSRSKASVDEFEDLQKENANVLEELRRFKEENELLKEGMNMKNKQQELLMKAVPLQRDEGIWNSVTTYCKKELFHAKQFVSTEELNKLGPKTLSAVVMERFNIQEEQQPSWWMTYKHAVHKALREARNGKALAVKKSIAGKSIFLSLLPLHCQHH
jgi:hypothetical protein